VETVKIYGRVYKLGVVRFHGGAGAVVSGRLICVNDRGSREANLRAAREAVRESEEVGSRRRRYSGSGARAGHSASRH
jgi:hypothetical protein